MERTKKSQLTYRVKLRFVKLLNVLLMVLPISFGWHMYYAERVGVYNEGVAVLVAVLYMVLYLTYGRIYDSFLVSVAPVFEMIYSQCLAFLISDAFFYCMLPLMAHKLVPVWPLLIICLVQFLFSASWCLIAHVWYFRTYPPKKTVVVYGRKRRIEKLVEEYKMQRKFEVIRMETVEACIEGQCRCLDGAEVVFLCGVHSHDRNTILKYCVEHGIVVYLLPRIGDTIMNGAKPMHLFHMPFLRVGRYDPSPEYMLLKRTFDIVVSGVALLVLSPLMLIVAIAIKATDGGPVFYKQTRLTKDGKEFDIVKFRSMRQDAEKDGVARLSSGESDPRITPIGRIIRKLRVDELPQLINIFTGSMSFVGPRPERPEIAKVYEKELPEFSLRLQAKAGLTGYAQVYGKYNTTPYDKLQLDLLYIAHPSFLEDLRIIFATVKILFMPKSVEGIDENAITAMENPEEELVEV